MRVYADPTANTAGVAGEAAETLTGHADRPIGTATGIGVPADLGEKAGATPGTTFRNRPAPGVFACEW